MTLLIHKLPPNLVKCYAPGSTCKYDETRHHILIHKLPPNLVKCYAPGSICKYDETRHRKHAGPVNR